MKTIEAVAHRIEELCAENNITINGLALSKGDVNLAVSHLPYDLLIHYFSSPNTYPRYHSAERRGIFFEVLLLPIA